MQNCPKFEQEVLNNVGRPHKKMRQKKNKKNKNSSPSAFPGTRGRIFVFLSFNGVGGVNRRVTCFFAECRSSPSVALGEEGLCRVLLFTECQDLCGTRESLSFPSTILPRVQHSGKILFPSARFLALGEASDTRGILSLP